MPFGVMKLDRQRHREKNISRFAHLPYRIETDRHGHILMSPPPAPADGDQQSEIVYLLKTLLPQEIRPSSEICPDFPLHIDL